MAGAVETVAPDTSVEDVARIMAKAEVGSVPVTEDGLLAGIVTDRDLVVRVLAEGRDPRSVTAGEVASTDVVTVGPDRPLAEARELMARNQIRRLPVVDEGRLVGILALGDIAVQDDAEQATGEALEEISRSPATESRG